MYKAAGFELGMSHELITVDAARVILDDCRYDGQRALRPRQVDYLAEIMREGIFMPFTIIVLYRVTGTGKRYLLDGLHRLTAVVKANTAQYFWIHSIVGEVGPEEVFITYDMNAARTQMDFLRSLGTFDGAKLGSVPAGAVASAMKTIIDEGTFHNIHHPKMLAKSIVKWMPYFNRYAKSIQGGPMGKSLTTSAYATAGAITFKAMPEMALSFWSGIAQDDGLSRNDPRKRLVDMLRDSESIIHTVGSSGVIWRLRFVAYFWNKHIEGEEVRRSPSLKHIPENAAFNGTGRTFEMQGG